MLVENRKVNILTLCKIKRLLRNLYEKERRPNRQKMKESVIQSEGIESWYSGRHLLYKLLGPLRFRD